MDIACVSAVCQSWPSSFWIESGVGTMPRASPGRSTPVGLPKAQPPCPIDQGLRRQFFRVMEEIDVAALGQGLGQRDVAVARTVANVDLAPLPVGLFQVSLAVERRRRIEPGRFQQGDGRDGLEHRAGRQGHLDRAMKERMGRIDEQGLAPR